MANAQRLGGTASAALRTLQAGTRVAGAPRRAAAAAAAGQRAPCTATTRRSFTHASTTVHDQHHSSNGSSSNDNSARQRTVPQQSEALIRTRSKIPTAKAKAAQASRAQLRPPQPHPVRSTDTARASPSSLSAPPPPQSASAHPLSQQQQQEAPPSPAQSAAALLLRSSRTPAYDADDEHDLTALPEVIAYSTAQAYDFAALARSGRLPPGWSFLEEGDVIHIPTWPSPSSAHDAHAHPQDAATLSATSYNRAPLPGETFIFRSGAYVTWGLTEDQARRFHRAVIRGRPGDASSTSAQQRRNSDKLGGGGGSSSSGSMQSLARGGGVEVGAYDQIGDEAMEYLIREDQPTRVVGDLIVLGHKPRLLSNADSEQQQQQQQQQAALAHSEPDAQPSSSASAAASSALSNGDSSSTYAPWSPLLARLSFSLGLARSARLTTQEDSLDMFMLNPSSSLSSSSSSSSAAAGSGARLAHNHPGSARIPLSDIPRELERTGRVPLGRKEVIKRMGKLLRLRLEANLDVEESFLDDNAFWENERLQQHYESICRALDIDRRFKAFNEKLDHVESLLSTIRALLTESSTHRMELIIIILIAIEVLNAFFHQHQQLQQQTPRQAPALSVAAVDHDGEAASDRSDALGASPPAVQGGSGSGGFSMPSVSGLFRWLAA